MRLKKYDFYRILQKFRIIKYYPSAETPKKIEIGKNHTFFIKKSYKEEPKGTKKSKSKSIGKKLKKTSTKSMTNIIVFFHKKN